VKTRVKYVNYRNEGPEFVWVIEDLAVRKWNSTHFARGLSYSNPI